MFLAPVPAAPLPTVSQVQVSPAAFRVGPPATAGISQAGEVPTGATVTFTMSAAGHVLARVESVKRGHLKGSRCYLSIKKGKTCKVIKRVTGTVHLTVVAGANSEPFSGRIAGAKLAPGKYLMQITPYEGTTKGVAATAPFTIVA